MQQKSLKLEPETQEESVEASAPEQKKAPVQQPTPPRRARAGKSSSAFRTISEVADDLGVQQHVLRFWESKFSQVKPLKRGGGRRYYRPEDVELLRNIHDLLYKEGYTIKGVQRLLQSGKKELEARLETSAAPAVEEKVEVEATTPAPKQPEPPVAPKPQVTSENRKELMGLLQELKTLRTMLNS